jgi:hypothetical protein
MVSTQNDSRDFNSRPLTVELSTLQPTNCTQEELLYDSNGDISHF